jgi:hypothetical protein
MIKLKVPLKENLPMDNRCERPFPALPLASPALLAPHPHTFAKAKRNIDAHQEKAALYATQLFENCDPFDLECTETL